MPNDKYNTLIMDVGSLEDCIVVVKTSSSNGGGTEGRRGNGLDSDDTV